MLAQNDTESPLLDSNEESRQKCPTPIHESPMEWSWTKKLTMIGFMSFLTFNDCVASTMFTPNTPQIMKEFNVSSQPLMSMLISIHVIGYAIGPLFVAPMSEVYGRVPLTHASNVLFVFALILCAVSTSLPMLVFARILIGLAGCVPVTLVPGCIADLIPVQDHGKWMMLWSTGYLVGTASGPIFGGFMGLRHGWRSAFWLEATVISLTTLVGFTILRETFAPVILTRGPTRKSVEPYKSRPGTSLKDGLVRSVRIVAGSPVLSLVTLHTCAAFVSLYFLLTTMPRLFHDRYGFNEAETGFAYLGESIGFAVGEAIFGPLSDWYQSKKTMARGRSRPEDRLIPLIPANMIIALGLLIYGWSVQAKLHWMLPITGTAITAFGMVGVILISQLYVMDAFGIYAASANSMNIISRSALGAILPLSAPIMYDRLGYGWGNSILAFVALALIPLSFYLSRHGENWRLSLERDSETEYGYGTFPEEIL